MDAAYMTRVGELIRGFAAEGHTVIVTTNLNNEVFLRELLAKTPREERAARIVNLLELGLPKPVQRGHRKEFNRIIRDAVKA